MKQKNEITKGCAHCGEFPFESDGEYLGYKEYWCVNTECSEYEMPFDFEDWQAPRFYEYQIAKLEERLETQGRNCAKFGEEIVKLEKQNEVMRQMMLNIDLYRMSPDENWHILRQIWKEINEALSKLEGV